MKKFTLFVAVFFFGMMAVAQNGRISLRSEDKAECVQNDFNSLRANFSFSTIESQTFETEIGTFSEIYLPGTFSSNAEGEPTVPMIHELMAVPFGATPRVSIKNYTVNEYKLSDFGINTLMPRQPSLRKDVNPEDVEFVYNAASYQKRGLAEAPEATIEVQGIMRGIRIGSMEISPVSYDPVGNVIRVFNDIEVEVSFENADAEETERMLLNTYSPYFDVVYKQMFNHRAINDVYTDHPDLMAYPVHMLVIAPENYISTLEPWTNWKIQKGFDVEVYTTAQAGSNYNAIRSFVQEKYNTGVSMGKTPTFLILVGDVAQMPNTTGNQTQKVTDLYYGSIDSDYFPDMFYSRMSAETTGQLTAIINKILQYEQYTMPDPSYLNNTLLIAGWDSYWNPRVGQPTVNYATTYYYNSAHGFNNVYTYLTQGQYNGCYNNLNTGVGFANYTAHGGETSWADPSFTVGGVNSLTNANKYFLAMGNCCLAANFGYSQPCFGEAMIRGENKAAYSYIGSCPNTYWYEDYYFGVGATHTLNGTTPSNTESTTGVYDAVWMDDTYNTVSSMVFIGNLSVCYAHTGGYQTSANPTYYWQAYHVLGDGSIMPYRVQPTANTVSHAQTFPTGASTFVVSAQSGSYVGISKDNVLLGAALVPASGSVVVNVTPVTQSGNVKIVVTKPQRQPYTATIPTGSPVSEPCVQVDHVTPTELTPTVNTGLTVTMKNIGTGATTGNTTVTIASSDQYLTIVNGTASFPQMAANGGVATVSNAFTVRSAANTPEGHTFLVNATASNNGSTWSSTFTLTAGVPCVAPTNLTAVADGNSVILNWTASPTATSYKVFRGATMVANNVTETTYTNVNLSYNHLYCYTVKSNCANGETSDASNEACVTTEPEPQCEAPTNLTATVNDLSIALSWNASPTATSYKVYRNGSFLANANSTSYTNANLDYETEYCYEVTAVCPNGESDASNEACGTTVEIPFMPRNFNVEYIYTEEGNFGALLTWDVETRGFESYNVYRSTNGVNFTKIATIAEINAHNEYFDDVEIGDYYYELTVTYSLNGTTHESEPTEAVHVEITGIDEVAAISNIYPNPATDKLTVKAETEIKEIQIYDLTGAVVYVMSDCGTEAEINLDGFAKGVYFIKITTNTTSETRKFVKEM